jgi:regulator of cell morphogenesis and NO signaling
LVKHIVGTHHEYLKLDLPVLDHRLDKVVSVHGARDPEVLPRMAEVFAALRTEMGAHMHKEEAILFPFIEQYGRAEMQNRPIPPVPFGSIANPIAMMEREHVNAGDALGEIRTLANDFELPPCACSTVRALYEGLQVLEADLHVHIHLENNRNTSLRCVPAAGPVTLFALNLGITLMLPPPGPPVTRDANH